ncbi:uncharacterized protein LOC110627194 [Manihot esculenta]|uniref:Uncharacterized protein n=1 Tax=Manihot esculenta TaxID=3983 RepID=A0A2C9V0C8_MANES|nr:uncharacterized protein LOC110627194 [Manihot esculenta]OAY37665.1 hypothetical protein MANES_11G119400v8 [Manihot esculenta]
MEEDIDLDKQLVKSSYCGDDECTWLSSAVSTPSSVFEDYRFSTSLHVSIDEKLFISWLSRLEKFVLYLDKGSLHFEDPRVNANPEEKAEDILNNSTSPDAASDSSMNKSESFRSSSGQFCEDSTSCNNSLMPCSTNFDSSSSSSSSQMSDSDRISFLVPLVNLEGEDSQWISSDAELDSDYFSSGFPSPSCKNCEVSLWENNSLDQEVNLEDFDTDEPLFWPSQWKLDWNCEETWRCFSMSPRKYITDPGTLQHTSTNVVGTKFHVRRKDTNEGFRESPEFSSGSTASTLLERKQSKNNFIRKINPAPSRLRKSRKISMKIVPIEMENDLDKRKDKEFSIQQSNCSDRDFLEDDFTKNGEVPIEKLLGLGEFDGHEGVDSEFNEDIFSLEESL